MWWVLKVATLQALGIIGALLIITLLWSLLYLGLRTIALAVVVVVLASIGIVIYSRHRKAG